MGYPQSQGGRVNSRHRRWWEESPTEGVVLCVDITRGMAVVVSQGTGERRTIPGRRQVWQVGAGGHGESWHGISVK